MQKKEIQFFLNEISQSWLGEFLMSLVIKKSILEKLSFSEDRSCSVRMCGQKIFLAFILGFHRLQYVVFLKDWERGWDPKEADCLTSSPLFKWLCRQIVQELIFFLRENLLPREIIGHFYLIFIFIWINFNWLLWKKWWTVFTDPVFYWACAVISTTRLILMMYFPKAEYCEHSVLVF